MVIARTSLKNFLVQAKSILHTGISKGHKLTFVVGNESADLDSLTSSILFAYIRSNLPPSNAFTPFYIPVLNIPASDIRLRSEFLALLPYANLQPEDLITLDDLPPPNDLKSKLPPNSTRWILVDHNGLTGAIGDIYAQRAGGVIDHHEDEHKIPEDTGEEPRIITQSGSCTSLVANYFCDAWDTLASSASSSGAALAQSDGNDIANDTGSAPLWDAQLAKLALASVLIDTSNLKSQDKVTQHDTDAVNYFKAKILASPEGSKGFDADRFFKEISDAKRDVGNLRLHDILRKDYKAWKEGDRILGVSSVMRDIDFLVTKAEEEASNTKKTEAFLESLDRFAKERALDIFAIMTKSTSANGDFERELFVWARNELSVSAAAKFEADAKDELGLAEWSGSVDNIDYNGNNQWRKVFQQKKLEHSRKRVAPLMREAMKA